MGIRTTDEELEGLELIAKRYEGRKEYEKYLGEILVKIENIKRHRARNASKKEKA